MYLNPTVICVLQLFAIVLSDVPDDVLNPEIVGGDSVDIVKYPFIVTLRMDDKAGCGASIINKNFVVTAAHCIHDNSIEYSVCAGHSKRKNCLQTRDVAKIIEHEQYDSYTKVNDIALLELSEPLEFGTTIQPIELAEAKSKKLPKDEAVTVLGWGQTSESGTQSKLLKKVNLRVVDNNSCKSVYKELVPLPITDKMICAGTKKGGKDTCQGDSGGPLVYKNTLYGITSWGYGCGKAGIPGIYTAVAKYRGWIKKNARL